MTMDIVFGGGGLELNTSTLMAIWNELSIEQRQNLLLQTNTSDLHELVALLERHSVPDVASHYDHVEYKLAQILLLYIPPILLILGTIGNALSFTILMRRSMRRYSTYLYLAMLSVTDTLVLYIGLLRLWVKELTGYDLEDHSDEMCKATNLVGYTISTYSVWLIVAVTVERYVAVCYPLRAHTLCNRRRACHVMLAMLTTLFCINLHFVWTIELTPTEPGQDWYCDGGPGYESLLTVIWPWVDACLYSILPSGAILVLNILIIRNVIIAKKSRAQMAAGSMKTSSARNAVPETSYKLTFMLLTISFSFLIFTFPMNISLIATPFFSHSDDPVIARFELIRAITTLLMFINHSMNFYLYCATGQKFRQQLLLLFCQKCQPDRRRYDHCRLYTAGTLSHSTLRNGSRSATSSGHRACNGSPYQANTQAKASVAEIRKGDYVQVKVSPM